MAPAVVYLHIGSPKTGTTYLQNSLWANRETLAADGVLLPGRSRSLVGNGVSDLLKWRPAKGDLPASWRRLTDEIAAHGERAVVISHEHLHKATEPQWEALVDSLSPARIEVVLTARDIARSVPAQWQSSVRQRHTWTLGEYADSVAAASTDDVDRLSGAAHHFWRRQDSPGILRRFLSRLPSEQVRLVTVPPSGGDPDVLWHRFSTACGMAGAQTVPGDVSHESLGAASAEIMRLLNVTQAVDAMPVMDYKRTVNHALSRHTLAPRRGEEPGLSLPERHREWADQQASQVVDAIDAMDIEVIGDLDDLRPRSVLQGLRRPRPPRRRRAVPGSDGRPDRHGRAPRLAACRARGGAGGPRRRHPDASRPVPPGRPAPQLAPPPSRPRQPPSGRRTPRRPRTTRRIPSSASGVASGHADRSRQSSDDLSEPLGAGGDVEPHVSAEPRLVVVTGGDLDALSLEGHRGRVVVGIGP